MGVRFRQRALGREERLEIGPVDRFQRRTVGDLGAGSVGGFGVGARSVLFGEAYGGLSERFEQRAHNGKEGKDILTIEPVRATKYVELIQRIMEISLGNFIYLSLGPTLRGQAQCK